MSGAVPDEPAGPAPGRQSPETLPPRLILVVGLLVTAVCMLLLFGPFYPPFTGPGDLLRLRLSTLISRAGEIVLPNLMHLLALLVRDRIVLLVLAVCVLALALVPWRVATGRQRRPAVRDGAARSAGSVPPPASRVSRIERRSSLSFADDGSIVPDEDGDGRTTELTLDELQLMARALTIPWRPAYRTEGGARALLEIIRATQGAPGQVRRAPAPDADVLAAADPARQAADEGPGTDGEQDTTASWSASSSGSVYTSTTLYRSERMPGRETDPDEEER